MNTVLLTPTNTPLSSFAKGGSGGILMVILTLEAFQHSKMTYFICNFNHFSMISEVEASGIREAP